MNSLKKASHKKESETPADFKVFDRLVKDRVAREKQITPRLSLIEKKIMAEIVIYDYKNNTVKLNLNKPEAKRLFEVMQEIPDDDFEIPMELNIGTSNRLHGWLVKGTINSNNVELIMKLKKYKKDKVKTIKDALDLQIIKQNSYGIPGYGSIKLLPSGLKAKYGNIFLKKKEGALEEDESAMNDAELNAALAETNYAAYIEGKEEAVRIEYYSFENVVIKAEPDTKGNINVDIRKADMLPFIFSNVPNITPTAFEELVDRVYPLILQPKNIKVTDGKIDFKPFDVLAEEIAMTQRQLDALARPDLDALAQPIMKAALRRKRNDQREIQIEGAIKKIQYDSDTQTLHFTIPGAETNCDIHEAMGFMGIVDITMASQVQEILIQKN